MNLSLDWPLVKQLDLPVSGRTIHLQATSLVGWILGPWERLQNPREFSPCKSWILWLLCSCSIGPAPGMQLIGRALCTVHARFSSALIFFPSYQPSADATVSISVLSLSQSAGGWKWLWGFFLLSEIAPFSKVLVTLLSPPHQSGDFWADHLWSLSSFFGYSWWKHWLSHKLP